ncbi:MAG TPA: EAL domain-containing protein [Gammaproteobacteria bacterium]|nr:EAL domain-containing protein [Gammaproteobacteria bacterium]
MITILICAGSVLLVVLLAVIGRQAKKRFLFLQDHLRRAQTQAQHLVTSETELKKKVDFLENQLAQVTMDPLTETVSWQLFEEKLGQAIKESARYHLTIGVLYLTINEIEVVQHAFGEPTSRVLLKDIAALLQSTVREVDCVSRPSNHVFAIFLNRLNSPEAAAIVAHRLLQILARPLTVNSEPFFVTASMGIAIFPTDGTSVSTLSQHAEAAMQLAKKKGKYFYQFYQEKTQINSQRELSFYLHLKNEIIFKELVAYYQPIIDRTTQDIFAVVATVCWQPAEWERMELAEIFEFAEKNAAVNKIFTWLIEAACKQWLRWHQKGCQASHLSIRVSAKQLEQEQFVYEISQVLQELSFPASSLLLEIKMPVAGELDPAFQKALNMLSYLGVRVAMVDFGRENFSLSQLISCQMHYLILSTVLTERVTHDKKAALVIKSLLEMAKQLEMRLIVEQVETQEQSDLLTQLGCNLQQGRFLNPAMTEAEVAAKYARTTDSA